MRSVPLGEVCEIVMGQAPDGESYNTEGRGLPLIAGAGDFGVISPGPNKFTTEPWKRSAPNDIILCIRATIGDLNWSDREYCLGRGVAGLRPSSGGLDRRYLWWALDAKKGELASKGRGATFKQINRDDIVRTEIPLPELRQQRRIAAILDAADALRAKRRAALAKLDTLAQSIFVEMFASDNSRQWPLVRIDDLKNAEYGGIRTGPFGSQLLHSEFVESGVAVLGIDNAVANHFRWAQRRYISLEKYEELKRYTVHPGDVVITIMGTCGRCAIIPDGIPTAINTKHLCCITLDREKCLPEFLHRYFLTHSEALAHLGVRAKGAIMDGLNMGIIKQMPVRLPPIAMQQQYVGIVRELDRAKEMQVVAMDRADSLFASLQHRAFSGGL